MLRKIIKIDEEKCNGCSLCARACHEGAIEMVNGKAKLTKEDFCDGFGDCLPACPTGAISFEVREAPEYNEKAVLESKKIKENISNNRYYDRINYLQRGCFLKLQCFIEMRGDVPIAHPHALYI